MTGSDDLESLKPDLPFRWVPSTLEQFAEPFYQSHPLRAGSVKAALDLIAADPYALKINEYLGHDESIMLYQYEINQYLSIVYGVIPNRSWLVLRGILDYRDLT